MLLKKLKPCKIPGCVNLTRNTYCNIHLENRERYKKETNRIYQLLRTDIAETAFYHSSAWKRARKTTLQRDYGLCQECLKHNRITFAQLVHHVIPVKERWDLRLEQDNLTSLCESCHNRIHNVKLVNSVNKKQDKS